MSLVKLPNLCFLIGHQGCQGPSISFILQRRRDHERRCALHKSPLPASTQACTWPPSTTLPVQCSFLPIKIFPFKWTPPLCPGPRRRTSSSYIWAMAGGTMGRSLKKSSPASLSTGSASNFGQHCQMWSNTMKICWQREEGNSHEFWNQIASLWNHSYLPTHCNLGTFF